MMFLFPKKKITLDCFINSEQIATIFPVCKTIDVLPDWWKSMPKTVTAEKHPIEISTIKRCPGFRDLFNNSFTIPAWSEYKLFQDPNHGFSHGAPNNYAEAHQHQPNQMAGAFPNYQHYKLISPWFIKETSGIHFSMVQAGWHSSDPCEYHIPPGCLEFKYQHSTHINFISAKKESLKEYSIPAGKPLVYLIPLSDKKINLNIHVVTDHEITKLKTYHHSFYNSYEVTKKKLREKI
jgi:hypothetical protein